MAKSNAVPKGYNTVTTYLNVKGANDTLAFMQKAFGAKIVEKHLQPNGKIMHAEIIVGDTRLMVGEATKVKPMPALLYMYVPDADAVYKKAIKAGAKSLIKPTDYFYGDRSATVQDKTGNQWWIATRKTVTKKKK